MNLRNNLLWTILPPTLFLLGLFCWGCHTHWSRNIIENYRSKLQLITLGYAKMIDGEDYLWLDHHRSHPSIRLNEKFLYYHNIMQNFADIVPSINLYTATIKPVLKGDTVLQHHPKGPKNPINCGENPLLAYRKVYLFYPLYEGKFNSHPNFEFPEEPYDFCQNSEETMCYQEKSLSTPVYRSLKSGKKMISAYAPIFDHSSNIVAFVGADIPFASIQPDIQKALFLTISFAIITVGLTVSGIFFIISRISKPLQILNTKALEIASGEYGHCVALKGPLETQQLCESFNVMSCCLKERHHGTVYEDKTEHQSSEAAHFLQKEFFDKILFHEKGFSGFHYWGTSKEKGRRLYILKEKENTTITWNIAKKEGVEGLLELASIKKKIDGEAGILISQKNGSWKPIGDASDFSVFYWNTEKCILEKQTTKENNYKKILIITNKEFELFLNKNTQNNESLYAVFSIFIDQPLSVLSEMTEHEIERLIQKTHFNKNIFIIFHQID